MNLIPPHILIGMDVYVIVHHTARISLYFIEGRGSYLQATMWLILLTFYLCARWMTETFYRW
jgi:hypothetical protein